MIFYKSFKESLQITFFISYTNQVEVRKIMIVHDCYITYIFIWSKMLFSDCYCHSLSIDTWE